jgi:short-subunit dehydrogenase
MQTIWITGASQGLGKSLALAYAQQGYRVYASARHEARLNALVNHAYDLSGEIIAIPLDITEQESVTAGINKILHQYPLDRAILNAGTYLRQPVTHYSSTQLQQMVTLNLVGTSHCIEAILPHMLARQAGQIAIVASLAGYRGLPSSSGYGASKAGLINLAESLKLDLAPLGIDIRLINPGFVKTPLTDRNEFAMPDIISADTAAQIILDRLETSSFEIRFPTRFAKIMGMLRHLPYSFYFNLVRRITGDQHESK